MHFIIGNMCQLYALNNLPPDKQQWFSWADRSYSNSKVKPVGVQMLYFKMITFSPSELNHSPELLNKSKSPGDPDY